jgi:hypothetical protein
MHLLDDSAIFKQSVMLLGLKKYGMLPSSSFHLQINKVSFVR